jgi:hypothetical protein
LGIAGIEREDAVERESGRRPIEVQRLVAAQRHPVGVADRRDRSEPIERAAQYHHQKARIAAFCARRFGQIRPGEQDARAKQQFATRGGVGHRHLR